MKTKTRSPLHGASRADIAALRALIAARLAWERTLGTTEQQLRADEPLTALSHLPFSVIERVRHRSTDRWVQMPHFDESYAVYKDQHLRTYNRAAWEQKELRLEVERLRAEVAVVKGSAA